VDVVDDFEVVEDRREALASGQLDAASLFSFWSLVVEDCFLMLSRPS
jgi:hypothetical protein